MAGAGAVPAAAATSTERVVRAEFTGSAAEYFRIWIVNLFFSLVTLGIYSAWAKVRKKRYFYGSTHVDGDSFDYFGSPKAVLKGRIVAVLLFVVYAFSTELYPQTRYAFWAAFLVSLPWLAVRALTFNARNSAYRGLRFNFTATPKEAVKYYVGMPLIVAITFGLGYPWFVARNKSFVVSHHALGLTGFGCDLRAGDFYKIYFLAGLMMFGLAIPIGGMMGFVTTQLDVPESLEWARFIIPLIPMYAAYALVYAYVQSRTTNLLWKGAHAPGLKFASKLEAGKLAGMYIGNVVAAVATLGLLIPWGVVRTLRYRIESFSMTVDGDDTHEANPALESVGATGQEFGDIFNLDLGL
jgi:uncharacterized membrane protein YjgN (DUF898 family)